MEIFFFYTTLLQIFRRVSVLPCDGFLIPSYKAFATITIWTFYKTVANYYRENRPCRAKALHMKRTLNLPSLNLGDTSFNVTRMNRYLFFQKECKIERCQNNRAKFYSVYSKIVVMSFTCILLLFWLELLLLAMKLIHFWSKRLLLLTTWYTAI